MKFFLLILLSLTINLTIFSESIILDDGQILNKEILTMDVDFIYCKSANGEKEKISRDKVIRVVYKEISKEDLPELLTDEEKKKIENKKQAKLKELEKLKEKREEEKEKKKRLAEKKIIEEERKRKNKSELLKSISENEEIISELKENGEEKDKEIKELKEKEIEKDRKIAGLEEEIKKLEDEIKETNSILENSKKEFTKSNKELVEAKKEIADLKLKLKEEKKEVIWGVVGRSAVLPGWGHIYINKKTTGYVYSGLFWGSFLFTFKNYLDSKAAKKEYDNTFLLPTQEGLIVSYFLMNQKYSSFSQSEQNLNQSISILSLVYIVQLTHAYFSGKSYTQSNTIGFREVNSNYTPGLLSQQNKRYEIYYQFQF